MTVELSADALTIEYDTVQGKDAIMIVPFPNTDPDDGRTVKIHGSVADLRGVVDTMSNMLDSLEDN